VFYVNLRTNRDYFPIQHWLAGLYNWDGESLLRGTDWIFNYNYGSSQVTPGMMAPGGVTTIH